MSSPTMTELEKTRQSQTEGYGNNTQQLDSSQIQSIQTADGWHNVSDCKVVPFAVSNSPVYKFYPSLWYKNEYGQETFTPLNQIISFSKNSSKGQTQTNR